MDSGTSNHMTYSTKNFTQLTKHNGNMNIHVANGDALPISAISRIDYPLPLNHVLYSYCWVLGMLG